MATSYGALCSEFYVNQRLGLKLDLPEGRDTLLHFFDRVRKGHPDMNQFRRFEAELALEGSREASEYRWLSLCRTSLRAGHVKPATMEQATAYHKFLLDQAPHHLSISPLDVDYLELMFGFDLECEANHDQILYSALFEDSPMGELLTMPEARVMDAQPLMACSLTEDGQLQAEFEACSRPRNRRGSTKSYEDEPISVLLTVRQLGPLDHLDQFQTAFDLLAQHGESLATDRLIPQLLTPIARQIASNSA